MIAELPRLRSCHGESTRLWAGDRVRVGPEGWVALSGAASVDYNVALCHGGGVHVLARTREEILAAGAPGLMMVAGAALGEVHELADSHWVCIGAAPFMARRLEPGPLRPSRVRVVMLDPGGLHRARTLIAEVFGLDEALALVALPHDALATEGRTVWAALDSGGAIASCLVSVAVQDIVVIWSMATAISARRQGYGAAVLQAALHDAAGRGSRTALLHSSGAGESFYRSAGFSELERWQLWSRPRWVLRA